TVTAIGHRLTAGLRAEDRSGPDEPVADGAPGNGSRPDEPAAGGAPEDSARPAGPYPARWPAVVRMVALLPALFAAVEGLDRSPHPTVPAAPAAFRAAEAPTLVLPSDARDQMVMLWSTDGFGAVVNGTSGFVPASQAEIRRIAENFPDEASVDYLRDRGVRSVVVLRDHVAGTPYERALTADAAGLQVRRTEYTDGVVFRLDPR
ncbi:MAG TPA: hypothetical protein VGR21_11315, partial [Cryptosporangiaceae bacterium]|nr:hypothetical protein [Cryptosporangiaceae bacterium]